MLFWLTSDCAPIVERRTKWFFSQICEQIATMYIENNVLSMIFFLSESCTVFINIILFQNRLIKRHESERMKEKCTS